MAGEKKVTKRTSQPFHKRLFLVGLTVMILFVLPGGLTEVVSLPRQLLLAVLTSYLASYAIPAIWRQLRVKPDFVFLALTFFALWLWIALLLSGSGIREQLMGQYGRNTGAITYTCLLIVLIYLFFFADRTLENSISRCLAASSAIVVLYAILQRFGLDPIPWNNQSSWVVGTFGNPNFLAAFLGISTVVTIGLLLQSHSSKEKFFLLTLLVGQVAGNLLTQSRQGLMIALAGSFTIVYLIVLKRGLKREVIPVTFIYLALAVLALMGTLNRGPLSSLFYEVSVTYRGDYWRAGIAMGIEKPLLGQGIDQYGDNYRAFRDAAAGLRRANDVTSNSAHNVYIDLLSGGGFPLFLAYLLITSLSLFFGIKSIVSTKEIDHVRLSIVAAFASYLIQSIISINQLTLAFIGWTMMGVIFSWYRESKSIGARSSQISVSKTPKLLSLLLIPIFIFPTTQAVFIDSRYYQLVREGDLLAVIDYVSDTSVDNEYRNLVVASLGGEDSSRFKRDLIEISLKEDPEDVVTLTLLRRLLIEEGDLIEAEKVRLRQIRLDPFNPEIQSPIR